MKYIGCKVFLWLLCIGLAFSYEAHAASRYVMEQQQRAQEGDKDAQFSLGALYIAGFGVDQDYVKAKIWLEKAAKQGHVGAAFGLGALYSEGLGMYKNIAEARNWFARACRYGDKAGCAEYQRLRR